jgi:hypothetical protein
MPELLRTKTDDIMGRIDRIAARGVPRELLILLSSGLFEAGKTAQRIGAPVGKLADWCRECAIKEPGSLEQIISLGMAADTVVTLSEALANVGQHARLSGLEREVGDLAFDFVLAGRRAELVASAVSLSEKWRLQRADAA